MKDNLFYCVYPLLKYFPFEFGVKLRKIVYPIFFKSFGKNVRIKDAVTIKYPSNISIGDNLTINQYCYLDGFGGMSIGDNVMIGAGTKIITASHITDDIETPMLFQGLRKEAVLIGNDIWIGFDVKILGGVSIGDSNILATNAVVTKSFYDKNLVIGGIPAKVISYRVKQ